MRFVIETLSKKLTINNEMGLHARPAASIAKLAQNARSDIWLIRDNERVDASSIIDILMLACEKGSELILQATHQDDSSIFNNIIELFENDFGE